jgi:hypothetical protein
MVIVLHHAFRNSYRTSRPTLLNVCEMSFNGRSLVSHPAEQTDHIGAIFYSRMSFLMSTHQSLLRLVGKRALPELNRLSSCSLTSCLSRLSCVYAYCMGLYACCRTLEIYGKILDIMQLDGYVIWLSR